MTKFNLSGGESQVILGYQREGWLEGRAEAIRTNLLKVIRARLQHPVAESIRLAAEGTNDSDLLARWFDEALTADDITALREAMNVHA